MVSLSGHSVYHLYAVTVWLCLLSVSQAKYACGQGYYGAECQQECGHCHDLTQCVHTNGSCLTGCEVGYHGETCQTPCPYGFFGLDCADRCKDTCDGCNRFNGSCDSGCNPGWQGYDCQDACDQGSFGDNCLQKCRHCRDVNQCSNINGTCLTGCDAGYQGKLCKTRILSGGRTIHLSGNNLNIGNMEYAVTLTNVDLVKSQVPLECTLIKALSVRGNITCIHTRALDLGMYKLKVTFDTSTEVDSNLLFEYLPDPIITSTEPAELNSIGSGGTTFKVIGEGFIAIYNLTVGFVDSEARGSGCRILTQTKLECTYPSNKESEKLRKEEGTRSNIAIYLDGFSHTFTSSVLYVDDPLFAAFNDNTTYNFNPRLEDSIKLVGKNLTTETEKKDYLVFVGPGHCTITSLTETELVCRPPIKEPTTRLTEDKLFIRVKVGNIEQIVGIIEYIDQPPTLEYHSRRAPCAVNCHCHCVCCCNGTQTTSSKKDENCEHYESDTRP